MVDLPNPEPQDAPATRSAEDADYINELNFSLPDGSERIGKGDDHIRVIKSATLGTFKNFVGSNLLGVQEFVRYSTDDLNNLKKQINGINGITYYIPHKTAYDLDPTATTYEKTYAFTINNIETASGSGKRIISSKLSLPPLGEIFATIFTEQKLNEIYGITYTRAVPNNPLIFKVCDGSNIANSRYGQLFSVATVPNFKTSGIFLASLDDEAKNTIIQSKSYPKGTTYTASYDVTLLNGLLQNDSGHNHSVGNSLYISRVVAGGVTNSENSWWGGANNITGIAMQDLGSHGHTYTPPALTVAFPTPATETRPNNIEINYVMRIN